MWFVADCTLLVFSYCLPNIFLSDPGRLAYVFSSLTNFTFPKLLTQINNNVLKRCTITANRFHNFYAFSCKYRSSTIDFLWLVRWHASFRRHLKTRFTTWTVDACSALEIFLTITVFPLTESGQSRNSYRSRGLTANAKELMIHKTVVRCVIMTYYVPVCT